MKKFLLGIVFLISTLLCSWGQEPNNVSVETERPSVALVLAGGGARGFSHIPVIELIEELGIPIDMVIGTSAGAIVGGLYSAGYSGEEIAQILLNLNWPTLFQDSTTPPFESALGSHASIANIVNIQFKNDLSLELGKGLLSGQYIYDMLKSHTVKIPSYIHFDSLITPFRATAVDLLTGELVVMEAGDLAEAIRSSMSIPAVFEPFPIDGRYYMDGFTRNNLPIQVAKDLGYDIIIAVEITDRMTNDADSFSSTPLAAINQVMALQQAVVVSAEYELADLIVYPDIYDFGQMDYPLAPQIYDKGKKEAERYRDDFIKIRSKIFPDFDTGVNTTLTRDTESVTDSGFAFTFVTKDSEIPFVRQESYSSLPNIYVDTIKLYNALPSDEIFIKSEFEKIKHEALSENEVNSLLNLAYKTGNYILITARIDKRSGKNNLELDFVQKPQNTTHLNITGSFEGSLSNASSWAMNLATTVQFKDLNDMGGTISLRGSFFNTTGLELQYMQPVSKMAYLLTKANINYVLDVLSSGFKKTDVSGSQLRHANASFACGLFFSPEHKLLTEAGLRWVDSTLSYSKNSDSFESIPAQSPGYAFDFSTRYTFNMINYQMYPTRGFYSDIKGIGVMPLFDISAPIIFDVVSADLIAAVPFSEVSSMVINTFIGTNITGGLREASKLTTRYGYTTYDRTFFPHIMQRHTYGIHKLALKLDFLFQPRTQLTILGGQFFAGFGAAAGGVWETYESFVALKNIEWQASALSGVRINDYMGFILRAGAGNYDNEISPFISLDFMVKHY